MGKVKELMYGDKIGTVGQLRVIMSDLDDHDQICIEAIDLETGDVQDLYPMNVDVIDNIRLTDDTIVREVRFCQMPNSAPDTRDKQPLVDAVIEQLKDDISKGDETVIDELLKFLPWEILKQSLPEELWAKYDAQNPEYVTFKYKKEVNEGQFIEVCPECDTEVDLYPEFKTQECPNCHKPILPCSMCRDLDLSPDLCQQCPLNKS